MADAALIITCEHAVNTVPLRWRHLFEDVEDVLSSHRGWDAGALELARTLADALCAPCFSAEVSRLLVDHNRSPHNRSRWSDFSRNLAAGDKEGVDDEFYRPFREKTSGWIAARHAEEKRVIHVSVHSFTPILDGNEREVDIGLLYDPGRPEEAYFAARWKAALIERHARLRVRYNVPYRGVSDSHLTTYRERYRSHDYVGIELEVNQALVRPGRGWTELRRRLAESLHAALRETSLDE